MLPRTRTFIRIPPRTVPLIGGDHGDVGPPPRRLRGGCPPYPPSMVPPHRRCFASDRTTVRPRGVQVLYWDNVIEDLVTLKTDADLTRLVQQQEAMGSALPSNEPEPDAPMAGLWGSRYRAHSLCAADPRLLAVGCSSAADCSTAAAPEQSSTSQAPSPQG